MRLEIAKLRLYFPFGFNNPQLMTTRESWHARELCSRCAALQMETSRIFNS